MTENSVKKDSKR